MLTNAYRLLGCRYKVDLSQLFLLPYLGICYPDPFDCKNVMLKKSKCLKIYRYIKRVVKKCFLTHHMPKLSQDSVGQSWYLFYIQKYALDSCFYSVSHWERWSFCQVLTSFQPSNWLVYIIGSKVASPSIIHIKGTFQYVQ